MFNEDIFIYSLTTRPEDARRFSQMFKPEWLSKSEYAPILSEIYKFTKKSGEPPSLSTLHTIFRDKDESAYELRYRETLENLQKLDPDRSEMIYTLDQVKGVAVIRSFAELCNNQGFLKDQMNNEGTEVLKAVHSWLTKFSNTGEDRTFNLKQAVDVVLQSAEFNPVDIRIPTGIRPLDDWTGGGLRKKQLAIIVAPTGHGKSVCLLSMGHKMAYIEQKNVWIITNELTAEEVTERELSKLTGVEVEKIINDPTTAYKGLERYWKDGLDNRIYITEYTREVSVDDIESDLNKLTNLYGWKPDVIILDYMERMRPAAQGYRRDSEWVWMGAVAKDLIRLAKRYNMLVWTAAQTNRAGLASNEISLDQTQGSIRHLQEATAVIAMQQIDLPNSDSVAIKLKPLKMRQSKRQPRAVTLECNLSKMTISNMEIDLDALMKESLDEEKESSYNSKGTTPRERQKARSSRKWK